MAFAPSTPTNSSASLVVCGFRNDESTAMVGLFGRGNVVLPVYLIRRSTRLRSKCGCSSGRSSSSGIGNEKVLVRSRLGSTQLPIVENVHSHSAASSSTVEIPVTCYQIIGLHEKAEKDEVVKAVLMLKNAEVEEGYTANALKSRQEILMDLRDKLLFEPEYAGDVREKMPPKSRFRIPWAWLPGALCLLQEVGEEKLVLNIGKTTIQHMGAKPFMHDLLLSMALAECSIAKAGFEKNNVSQGFEALAHAQSLLRSQISLGKMSLLSQMQRNAYAKIKVDDRVSMKLLPDFVDSIYWIYYEIEESLEELAPVCTLDFLGIPQTPENAERRRGAISALRELLGQGLNVEGTCQVEDWSCFLAQALSRLLASEVVNLLPWDGLAATRNNKKSIESQKQRAVVDSNCFYSVMMAYLALGFSSKQMELVNKAKTICKCLMSSDGVDLKLEEFVCMFLTGQCSEAEVVAKLRQLEQGSNTASRKLFPPNEVNNTVDAKPLLEKWLKEDLLSRYPDTRDCSPSLANFFKNEKKHFGNQKSIGTPHAFPNISRITLSTRLSPDQRTFEGPFQYTSSLKQPGSAVQQLTQTNMQNPLLSSSDSTRNSDIPTVQIKKTLGAEANRDWEIWTALCGPIEKLCFVTLLGCIIFAMFKLSRLKFGTSYRTSSQASNGQNSELIAIGRNGDTFFSLCEGRGQTKQSTVPVRLVKLLTDVESKLKRYSDAARLPTSCPAASLSSSMTSVFKRPMPLEEAELLVKQWQAIKADALGPNHQIHSLAEVLDGSMLSQWVDLANAAVKKACFWRFVMLQLSIFRADVATERNDAEIVEIEALLEEVAELVDESQPKNPNYYSTYKILYVLRRQKDGSWKFCESNIDAPS